MNCENDLCVYNSKGKCIIEEISVDSSGMCAACIYPNIDEKILEKAKNNFLERYKD